MDIIYCTCVDHLTTKDKQKNLITHNVISFNMIDLKKEENNSHGNVKLYEQS